MPNYRLYTTGDYEGHLLAFKKFFLATPGISATPLYAENQKYLNELALDIVQHNEIFFTGDLLPQITVINHNTPFHFSLPHRQVFISTGLLNKYVKHESVLVSILTYELIRSERDLYNKAIIVPLGYIGLERLLGLNRLKTDEKMEIHKWAYHFTRRAGYDGEYYLSWIQLQNRNTMDFLLMLGDTNSISREEALFKAFLTKRSNRQNEELIIKRNSSKKFYKLLFNIKDESA